MAYSEETSKQSLFNAGVAQAIRIDVLQQAVNAARFNPQDFNPETKTFNYQIIISSLDGLLMESWSKLNSDEKKEIDKISTLIRKMLELSPPMRFISKGTNTEIQWNEHNFKKLLHMLTLYEKSIKEALDSHSLNSPNRDDDDGL